MTSIPYSCVASCSHPESCAGADKMRDRIHKFPRAVGLHTNRKSRLVGLAFLGGFHGHKGHGVGAVLPAAGLAAHGQVLELVVPSKIVCRVGRDRPHLLGIFEPERIDKLLREDRLQGAVLHILQVTQLLT